MEKKVYCIDCKYFQQKNEAFLVFNDRCLKVLRVEKINTPQRQVRIKYGPRIEENNALNDCEHYKRKWWKFWK